MNQSELMALYPKLRMSSAAALEPGLTSLPLVAGYLVFPTDYLSHSEQTLLTKLFNEMDIQPFDSSHPWRAYLAGQATAPKEMPYRLLHFDLGHLAREYQTVWLNSLKELLRGYETGLFLSGSSGVVFYQCWLETEFLKQELVAIFTTLDADFDTNSQVYIGEIFNSSHSVQSLFKEEERLFQEERSFSNLAIFSFQDIALHYLTAPMIEKSTIIRHLRKRLMLDDELQRIIAKLWQTKGNLSVAAKELFIHRNTLMYKLDKFYEATGFSLKENDDLLICYLLSVK